MRSSAYLFMACIAEGLIGEDVQDGKADEEAKRRLARLWQNG